MKVYITENELYPCYTVLKKPGPCDHEITVPEAVYLRWREAKGQFYEAQEEIRNAIIEHERKQQIMKDLRSSFEKKNPSRMDKGYILKKFGWEQVDTSLWKKGDWTLRLHLAYEECKKEFNERYDSVSEESED